MDLLEFYKNDINAYCAANSTSNGIASLRADALKRMDDLGFPTRRTERYKHTKITKALEKEYAIKGFDTAASTFNITAVKESFNKEGAQVLFFIDGLYNAEASDKLPIEVTPLWEKEEASQVLSSNTALKDDVIFSMNEATLHDGYYFNVPSNTDIEKPVIIYHLLTEKIKGSAQSNHNVFVVGKNSSLNVLEIYNSDTETESFSNYATTVEVLENGHFEHIHHQLFDKSSVFVNNIRAKVQRDASYNSFSITLGSKLSRNNIHIDLLGTGATCVSHGLYTIREEQHADTQSFIGHMAPHTDSSQLFKGIMDNKSHGVFTGLIHVARDAQLITSSQLNKNLILSKGAQANSQPQLEIFADDVKCAHGSTTGQLSDQELFYFESRGIRQEKAKQMLAKAFTYDVLLKIKHPFFRDYISDDINENFQKYTVTSAGE